MSRGPDMFLPFSLVDYYLEPKLKHPLYTLCQIVQCFTNPHMITSFLQSKQLISKLIFQILLANHCLNISKLGFQFTCIVGILFQIGNLVCLSFILAMVHRVPRL